MSSPSWHTLGTTGVLIVSIRKSVASGKTAASELHASEWATGSRIWRYMSGTFRTCEFCCGCGCRSLHEEDDKIVRRLRDAIGAKDFECSWVEGAALSTEDAIAYA